MVSIKEIWLLGEKESKEADRTISEKDLQNLPFIEIRKKEDQDLVIQAAKENKVVLVSGPDYSLPKIIALENLIAETQEYNTKLFSFAKSPEEVYSTVLSLGVGMNVIVEDTKLIFELRRYFSPINFDLIPLEVELVESGGYFGDRCCIDTVGLMSEGEGMLIGSSPDAYFLVHAETKGSEFTKPRQFRVNAGPVSNYTITDKKEGIKTNYLNELGLGSQVLVVDYKGNARRATVNNNKTEPREFVKISTEKYSVFLQKAETVCLATPDGEQISVLDLEPRDEVLVYKSAGGMHCGTQII